MKNLLRKWRRRQAGRRLAKTINDYNDGYNDGYSIGYAEGNNDGRYGFEVKWSCLDDNPLH